MLTSYPASAACTPPERWGYGYNCPVAQTSPQLLERANAGQTPLLPEPLPPPDAWRRAMTLTDTEASPISGGPTSTQVGAIGECLVAAGILEASGGRLSPFKPIADDDGMDLLLFDKQTRRPIPIQIKCRRSFDNEKARTLQFDVRLKTFSREGGGYLLCIKLDGAAIDTLWLIPTSELEGVARPSHTHLVVVASVKCTSQDRFASYRMTSMSQVAAKIVAGLTV